MAILIIKGKVQFLIDEGLDKMEWKKLYESELKDNPHLAFILMSKDGVKKILEKAKLSLDETEAWNLRGSMSEGEVAQIMGRQLKTVKELLSRAEYKLKHLIEQNRSE